MKPRRVILTIEVETDEPLRLLRDRTMVNVRVSGGVGFLPRWLRVLQVSANVVKPEKKKGKR